MILIELLVPQYMKRFFVETDIEAPLSEIKVKITKLLGVYLGKEDVEVTLYDYEQIREVNLNEKICNQGFVNGSRILIEIGKER